MKLFTVVVLLLATVPCWTAEVYTFSLLPAGGDIAGAPGATIGWGYSIENQSASQWLVTTALAPGSFQFGAPDLVFDFPIIAPGDSVTTAFDADALTGLLALTWDASAPLGGREFGSFRLSAEWWNGDPFAGGQFASSTATLSAPYSATVVPEPTTGGLIGLGIGVAIAMSVRRRQRSGTLA